MVPQERTESRFRLSGLDLKYLALLAAGIGIVFWDVILLEKAFLSGDHLIQHYPWAKFLQDSIRHFRLPWWTSEIQCGFPLLAEGQIGALYPPNLLFLFLLPLRWAYNYEILFHFCLGAFFFYLYVRSLGLSRDAAFFVALIFIFGSTEGGFFYNVTSQRVSIWFPLSLFLMERLLERTTCRDVAFLGLVFAFEIFAGYQQIAIYTLAFSVLYYLLRLISWGSQSRVSDCIRPLVGLGSALLVGAAVSAIQWFPFLELSGFSVRHEATESLAYIGSPLPSFLMTLLFPDWTGLWGGGIYVGVLGLFFVLYSLFSKKRPQEKLWFFILAFAVLLALGRYSPLYVFIVKAFKLFFFRIPTKFLFFAAFALAVLAGFGFDRLIREGWERGAVKKASFFLCGFFSAVLIALAVGNLIGHTFSESILRYLEGYVRTHILGQPYHPHSFEIYQEKLRSYYRLFLELSSFKSPETFWPVFLFTAQAGIVAFLLRRGKRRILVPGILFLLFTDLFFYTHINTRRDLVPYRATEVRSKLVEEVLQDPGLFRIHTLNPDPLRAGSFPLTPNQNMLLGVEDIGIYSPFAFAAYKKFLGDLGGVDDSLYQNKASLESLRTKRGVLDRLNVKYLFTNGPLDGTLRDFVEVGEENSIRLYKNLTVWPRVFFTERIDQFPRFDSREEVDILAEGEGRMILNTQRFASGYLVVSQENYPGWKVRRGDKLFEPVPLASGMKAIPLDGRIDQTELFFEQPHKRILYAVSGGGILLAFALIFKKKTP